MLKIVASAEREDPRQEGHRFHFDGRVHRSWATPFVAGLSHMAENLHEEGIVPASAPDFEADGFAVGVGSQDVEGEPPENGEVLRRVVLSGAVAVLGEVDVEHPVELVLAAPMTARDVKQPLGRDVLGPEIVAHNQRIGALAAQASARGDPATTPGKRSANVVLRMTVARLVSLRSWAERSICWALLRLPDRANCCVTTVNKGPRLPLIAST
jgi:hypothetical protein